VTANFVCFTVNRKECHISKRPILMAKQTSKYVRYALFVGFTSGQPSASNVGVLLVGTDNICHLWHCLLV